jgi:hypothetical protein
MNCIGGCKLEGIFCWHKRASTRRTVLKRAACGIRGWRQQKQRQPPRLLHCPSTG